MLLQDSSFGLSGPGEDSQATNDGVGVGAL